MIEYYLYTDGACQPNPGMGGWAFLLRDNKNSINVQDSGYVPNTTNNRMEMLAVIKGFEYFVERVWTGNEKITLFSDSQYLINGIMSWCDNWKKRGWKKKNKDDVLNVDLWKQLLELRDQINPKCQHVRGHKGHKYNEIVDQLAFQAAKKANRDSHET